MSQSRDSSSSREVSLPGGRQERTRISSVSVDSISLRGRDLATEIMGSRSFTELIFLLVLDREGRPEEVRLLDACLSSMADHGLTLSAMTARATHWAAPEAVQGAVAAGLAGVGSAVAGSMEDCGRVLWDIGVAVDDGIAAPEAVGARVAELLSAGKIIPGLGHRIHTNGDPRAERLIELADESGLAGREIGFLRQMAEALRDQSGADRLLPTNVTGATAAVLMGIGFEWWILRGIAVIARAAGLVAHLREERYHPLVPDFRRFLLEQ